MGRGPGCPVACGYGAADVAREERTLRQERRVAGVFRAFLLRVPSRAGAGERQLAARAWLRPAAAGRSGMEWFAVRRFSFAGATNGFGERTRVGEADFYRLRRDEQT